MSDAAVGEVLDGLWRFEAIHPDWTEDQGGEEGWEASVAWWALATEHGLALVDPLVEDWPALDGLLDAHGGCAGIVRTCYWHQRSVAEAAARYRAPVWAGVEASGSSPHPPDHTVRDGDELFGALRVIDVERADEIALWLPAQRALLFGDAMLRRGEELRVCPPSWTQPEGGYERLVELLRGLRGMPVEHVLVSHGQFVARDGAGALERATG